MFDYTKNKGLHMGTKISLHDVEKRLEGTGIKVVSYGGTSTSKSTFMCKLGHKWETMAHVVTKLKCGCPICAGNIKISFEEAKNKLKNKNIELLEWSGSTVSKGKLKCIVCNHTWETSLGNVLHGTGCKKCAGLVKRTKEEVNSILENRNIICTSYCGSTSGKSIFKCNLCKNEWQTSFSSINSGRGCSKCATYGFSSGKKTYLYLLGLSDEKHGDFIGFGITNSYNSRMTTHRVNCKKQNVQMREIAKFTFEDGKKAVAIENKLKKLMKKSGFTCSITGFLTESLNLNNLNDAIKIINDSVV